MRCKFTLFLRIEQAILKKTAGQCRFFPLFNNQTVLYTSKLFLFGNHNQLLDTFACCFIGFSWQIDGHVGLHGHDTQLQFGGVLW